MQYCTVIPKGISSMSLFPLGTGNIGAPCAKQRPAYSHSTGTTLILATFHKFMFISERKRIRPLGPSESFHGICKECTKTVSHPIRADNQCVIPV